MTETRYPTKRFVRADGTVVVRREKSQRCNYCRKLISREHGNFELHMGTQHFETLEARIFRAISKWASL